MNAVKKIGYSLSELINGLDNIHIHGDSQCIITGVATIQDAKTGDITFLTNPYYKKFLPITKASAIILAEDNLGDCHINAIVSRNPYFTYSQIAQFFETKLPQVPGIHPTATIHPTASIHKSAHIGAHCVIGADVIIDEHTQIDANVTIYQKVTIGKRVRIASGVVIGADGFGYANHQGAWHKVPQLGGVQIADDVDIGANTTIDRGAIEDTIIEAGVKLDNQIQVGHNVKIGANTIIAGCCAIAGSTQIGRNCMIGGSSNFAGHLSVVDNVVITGATNVTKSITEPGMYSSGIVGAVPTAEFRKNNARFYRLENLMERVKVLELTLKKLNIMDKKI